ncbi:hypothetical protein [Allopontixanthobacter sediminis]|uniref:CHAT domain-containing protein n=1 Tax=Allopontixanthobacter sediminis TaxID=1689985 RepID=A0A845B3Z8_9SPHN|nr:hypothetical protein [Allopontixanthobacter sediminis]MXP44864.1 hypothetical protein [Allopontixanthobacter sediminis]
MINPATLAPFEIAYVFALPDWEPQQVTPFQGFAPGLLEYLPYFKYIPPLPSDLIEPTLELEERLIRRRAGVGAWNWTPINLSTLVGKRKPRPGLPFMVLFSATEDTAKRVSAWRRDLRLKPIHISLHRKGGALHPEDLTEDVLRHHLIQLAQKAGRMDKSLDFDAHLAALNAWRLIDRRPSSLHFHWHNVTAPNEMTLIGAGELPNKEEEGRLIAPSAQDYIDAITRSTEAVMALWTDEAEGGRDPGEPDLTALGNRPDIVLLAPGMYRGRVKKMERLADASFLKRAFRALDRQRGYTMEMPFNPEGDDTTIARQQISIASIFSLRGSEMKLTTLGVGLRATGTLAATIRLPPAVNRTAGVVGQLARFLRAHENPPRVKSSRIFHIVQDALRDAIPPKHLELIGRSRSGIKIVADAPLEWLPIGGLPLGIRFDVSRIDTTPGNLFLDQIRAPVPLAISPDSFRNYLVLSMFDDGDQIAPHLRVGAVNTMDGQQKPIIGKFASPKNPEDFAGEINRFRGPMLIVDSHGDHPDGDAPGGLIIGGKAFDVWSLRGKVRIPPIVVLSACDTHGFDRSHATVANGFLACGALAVVGTSLPIRSKQAARFIMRLINRAVHFGGIMSKAGVPVPWSHIVGGVLRMDIAADIIRGFETDSQFDDTVGDAIQIQTNKDLNPWRSDWYERLKERVFAACAMERAAWDRQLADLIASSDAIRYVHLGNPEAILVAAPDVAAATFSALKGGYAPEIALAAI